jgi:hypothetical protein
LNSFSDPSFTVSVDVTGNAERAVEFLELQQPVTGNLQFHAEVNGSGSEITIGSTLQSSDLAYREIRDATLQLDSLWSSTDQSLLVRTFDLNSSVGRARLEGRVFSGGNSQSALAARLDGLNIRALSRQFELPVQVASYASGTADIRFPGTDIAAATGTARLRLRESIGSPEPNLAPVAGAVTVGSEGNRIQITASEMRLLGAQFNGTFTIVDRDRIVGELSGEVPKLSTAIAALNTVLSKPGEDAPYAGDLDGVVELSATIGGTLAQPTAQSNISARELRFGEVTGAVLSIRSQYQRNQLLFPEAALTWQDQTVTLEGVVGLDGDSPSLDLRLRAEQVSIGEVLAGLGKGLPVSGRANLSATAVGTVQEPEVSIDLSASELAAYGENFGSLRAAAEWAGQRLEVRNLLLDKPAPSGEAGRLEASGAFETESSQYTLAVKGERIELAGLSLPDGPIVRGRIDIDASGEGSVEEPAVEGKLELADLWVGDRDFGSLHASFGIAGAMASIEAAAEKFSLSAKGSMGVAAPHQAEIELRAENADLAQFDVKLPDGNALSGSISATVRASGPLDDWESGTLRADISGLTAALGKHELRNQGDLYFEYQNRSLRLGCPRPIQSAGMDG